MPLLTRAEATRYEETSRHADVMAFLAGIEAKRDKRLHISSFGASPHLRADDGEGGPAPRREADRGADLRRRARRRRFAAAADGDQRLALVPADAGGVVTVGVDEGENAVALVVVQHCPHKGRCAGGGSDHADDDLPG